ncbi:hypothetical protein V074_02584 [Staphylococcus aureus 2010-60-1240-1]|uniref:replication initiator protein A n=1 Tax=Staphylococcus aureus TaxID=1280 RepID=UPI0004486A97|nr:replication initiator protein A [Staphylococcus aureus]EZV57629.1 hypothetical protein V074_02584 [Staphylococcus aureus 2010-60-1240-1]
MKNTVKFTSYKNLQQEEYIEAPKFLFNDKSYNNYSFKTKTLYVSIYNELNKNWINKYKDNEGNEYIKFTNADLVKLSGLSETAVKRGKAELLKANLIFELENNQDKTKPIRINKQPVKNQSFYYQTESGDYNFTFYKIPKFLFHTHFKALTWECIMMYAAFRDRHNVSLKSSHSSRKFVDESGKIFSLMTNDELKQILNIKSDATIRKHKNTLLALNLIKQSEQKTKDGQTYYRYYVYVPIALPVENTNKEKPKVKYILCAANDKYAKLALSYNKNKVDNSEDEVKNSDVSGQKKSEIGSNFTASKHSFSKPSYKALVNNDMYDMYDMYSEYSQMEINKHSSQSNQSQNIIDFEEQKELLLNKMPVNIALTLKGFTISDIKTIMGIICNTKNEFNDDNYTDYTLEDFDLDISNMIKRVRNKLKLQNETVKAGVGLFKKSTERVFEQNDFRIKEETATVVTDDMWEEQIKKMTERLKNNSNNSANVYSMTNSKPNTDFEEFMAELDAAGVY